jgi:hypothetical protein
MAVEMQAMNRENSIPMLNVQHRLSTADLGGALLLEDRPTLTSASVDPLGALDFCNRHGST